MYACANCRHPRIVGTAFCTRCGTRYPPLQLAATAANPRYVPGARRYWVRPAALGLAGAALIAGAGVGTWYGLGRGGAQAGTRDQATASASAAAASGAGASGAAGTVNTGDAHRDSLPSRPAAAARSGAGPGFRVRSGAGPGFGARSGSAAVARPVTVTAAAAGNRAAGGVAAFLGEYFGAINGHDYQAYTALRSPRAGTVTEDQFTAGYGSTDDTDATLRGVASAASGDVVAQVTFDSHQSAAQSASGSACTTWRITLYLVPPGDGYLLDDPPPGYHARYAACR